MKSKKQWIEEGLYKKFQEYMPILCVDLLLVNEKGKCLLVKRKNRPLKGKYFLPGGRVYKGESIIKAAHRIANEELGIKIKPLRKEGYYEEHYVDGPYDVDVHTCSVVLLAIPLSKKIKLDSQSKTYKWSKKAPDRIGHIVPFGLFEKQQDKIINE